MSSIKFVFVFSVLAVSLRYVRAISKEERKIVQEATILVLEECSAAFGVSVDDIRKAKDTGILTFMDPCVIACIFKTSEIIDDKGLFVVDRAEEFSEEYLSDEADQKRVNGQFYKCKSVNDHEVTDGEKGCERGALLFECLLPLKDMFDY